MPFPQTLSILFSIPRLQDFDYRQVIPVFIEGGYGWYINSEYEGQRSTQDFKETDSCESVRRHHVMMKHLMGEA